MTSSPRSIITYYSTRIAASFIRRLHAATRRTWGKAATIDPREIHSGTHGENKESCHRFNSSRLEIEFRWQSRRQRRRRRRENVAELSRTSSRHRRLTRKGRSASRRAFPRQLRTLACEIPAFPLDSEPNCPIYSGSPFIRAVSPIALYRSVCQIDRDSRDSVGLRREIIANPPSPFLMSITFLEMHNRRSERDTTLGRVFKSTWKLLLSDGCHYYCCSRTLVEWRRARSEASNVSKWNVAKYITINRLSPI